MFEELGIHYFIVCLPGGQMQAFERQTEDFWSVHDVSDAYSIHGTVVKSALDTRWYWEAKVTSGWCDTLDEAIETLIAEVTEDLK